jgi:hypothetical protein
MTPGATALTAAAARRTARQTIEARLGKKWPPTRELEPDQRQAIKRLAVAMIKAKGKTDE